MPGKGPASINFKVIGLTQSGFENFEPATFRFPDLPERHADLYSHVSLSFHSHGSDDTLDSPEN